MMGEFISLINESSRIKNEVAISDNIENVSVIGAEV